MPNLGWVGLCPTHPRFGDQGSEGDSHTHLFAGLAAVAAAGAGLAGPAGLATAGAGCAFAALTTTGAGGVLVGLGTAVAGAAGWVPTTVSAGPGDACCATPMTLPSDSRRNAADWAGTIPMSAALFARLAGDFDASRDWLKAPWASV